MATSHHLISVLLAAALFVSATNADPDVRLPSHDDLQLTRNDLQMDCIYTVYVKTGSGFKAGSDSKIAMTLGDGMGRSVWVQDLEKWGLMGPSHDYYERGNIDAFSGLGPCIGTPVCRLNLTSDGSGHHHGWYCDYVEVTSTGPRRPCSQTIFYVDRWLASDVAPFDLTAMLDGCDRMEGRGRGHRGSRAFAVRGAKLSWEA